MLGSLKLLLSTCIPCVAALAVELPTTPWRQYHRREDPQAQAAYLPTYLELQPKDAARADLTGRREVTFKEAMQALHGRDIWEPRSSLDNLWQLMGVEGADLISPSSSPKFVHELVQHRQPSFAIEVGAFLGYTTSIIAKSMDALNEDDEGPFVLAIDTWLGDAYMWSHKRHFACQDCDGRPYFELLRQHHGYPLLYFQFMRNMLEAGVAHRVVPFPLPSAQAARVLDYLQWRPDLVYIDASHDTVDVLQDLEHFWFLLECGGLLFGDDYHWQPVRTAVDTFVQRRNLSLQAYWIVGTGAMEKTVPYNDVQSWPWSGYPNSKWVLSPKHCQQSA